MSFPVRILPRAKMDFRTIFSYIEEGSAGGAARWREAFKKGLQRVSDNPGQFGFAPEDKLTHFELRQFLFKTRHGLTYRAVFTVLDNDVFILRLRGPGQPPLGRDEMPLG